LKKQGFLMGLFVLLLGLTPVVAAAQPQTAAGASIAASAAGNVQLGLSAAPPDIVSNGSVVAPAPAINAGSGASANGTNTAPINTIGQQQEMRAAWVSTVFNIDWPSKAGLPVEQQKAEYIRMLDELKATGMNAIIVQVRPESDAIYPSKLVPWSKWLTGTQGKDPGYDPLAFMIEETHKRGMKFHAWFNPFRASTTVAKETLAPQHPARLHPNWVVAHNNLLIYNPGMPEVRQHIIDTIMEVVNNYNIDGVHLDDYFYPYGKEDFKDAATFAAYNQGRFATKGDWRRDNVNAFVRDLYASIKSVKPQVEFGISPFGIWRNAKDDPTGSDTNGQSSYDNLYADVRTWIRSGWLDYVAPQLYWSIGYKPAAYDKLVQWWSMETNGTPVKLYIGQGAYKVGTNTTDWASSNAIIQQLQFNKAFPQVQGSIFFSAKTLMKDTAGIRSSLKQYYSAENQ
jgi:uncharacterized lipoprotein YddW (UPF0748 family)